MLRPLVLTALAACTLAPAQEPGPYIQLDPKPHDPKTDVNMELFMWDCRDSSPRVEYGSLIVWDILTRQEGELVHPSRKGAVLTRFTEYAHATLYAAASTTPSLLQPRLS